MFTNLFNMSHKRNGIQALGFYIVYLILGFVVVALLSATLSVAYCAYNAEVCQTYEQGYAIGQKVGGFVGIVSCFVYIFVIGMWILHSKKLFQNAKAVSLYVLAILLAVPLGAILALVPLAFLTKFDTVKSPDDDDFENSAIE